MFFYNMYMSDIILIVTQDGVLREHVRFLLEKEGHEVLCASNGKQVMKMVRSQLPDMLVVDNDLPDIHGGRICEKVRVEYPDQRIMLLISTYVISDMVSGFEKGADDVMLRVDLGAEFVARVNARLQRKHGTRGDKQCVGDLCVNRNTREVVRRDRPISLSAQEFRLLQYMVENKGKVLTRDRILSRIWRSSYHLETRIVDVYIGYLRKKVDNPFPTSLIHSVRGFGYVMKI